MVYFVSPLIFHVYCLPGSETVLASCVSIIDHPVIQTCHAVRCYHVSLEVTGKVVM